MSLTRFRCATALYTLKESENDIGHDRLAERSKALASGASLHLKAGVRIP
jgi:hypothetical protein